MEWKDLFAKLKARDDHFNAESGPEATAPEVVAPVAKPVIPAPAPKPATDNSILTVGGTRYRKIKLKVVAAWTEETEDQIAHLVDELAAARREIAKLKEDNDRKTAQHTSMQQLNVNLHSLRIADIDKSTDRIAQLETKANIRQERIKEVEEQLREARMLIHEARIAIELLENENEALRSTISQQDKPSRLQAPNAVNDLQWH